MFDLSVSMFVYSYTLWCLIEGGIGIVGGLERPKT